MPGSIHVKNAKRRVAFAPRRFRAAVQSNERIPLKQAALVESSNLTSTIINCDSKRQVHVYKPKHASSRSSKNHSHPESEMATNGPNLNPDWSIFTTWPPIRDELKTETSDLQDKTIQQCLPLLLGYDSSSVDYDCNGLPKLDRAKHARFLHRSLQPLPAVAVGFDASRPWMVYWALTALNILGEDVTPYRERYVGGQATAHIASS